MGTESNEYQKGYAAGRRRADADDLARERLARRKERVFMQSLELTLKHCKGWQINGKTISSAEGYCTLAKIFAQHAITALDS